MIVRQKDVCICGVTFYVNSRRTKYCSRECSRKGSRGNKYDNPTRRIKQELETPFKGYEVEVALINRIVPDLDLRTKDKIVMFLSLLRDRGFEIVHCDSMPLKDLVTLCQNETQRILNNV